MNKIFIFAFLLLFGTQVMAEGTDPSADRPPFWTVKDWKIQTSVYTKHWDSDPDHVNNQDLINVEMLLENNWLAGGAFFQNSFGQDSWFMYMGYQWPLFHSEYFYFKLMGGLLYGYKDEYKDKIPLNGNGIAPAILPAFGFRYKFFITEVNIAGTAAITITAGVQF